MVSHRIGIFSGTFDPVHIGHITFAKEAIKVCQLDKVVFMPERSPRDKTNVTDISHRLELLRLATNDDSNLDVIESQSEQFTVKKTLPELHRVFDDSEFTLLIGSDVVRTFTHRWEDLDSLLSEVSLAIGMRAGDSEYEIITIIKKVESDHNITVNYSLIHTPDLQISSSQVRGNGANLSILKPDVVDYVQKHGLY